MFWRYKPHAGAGGAQLDLCFEKKAFLNSFKDHLPEDKYFKDPTIDLTWFCKKDFDLKIKKIWSPFLFTFTECIFFIGDFAEQDEALNVEKSWVPSKIFAPFFNRLILSFFLTCHALLLFKDNDPSLLIILYSYILSLASNLEWKVDFFLLMEIIDIKFFPKKKFNEFKNFF